MKKILITGGQGFIASWTIKEAQNRGYRVITNVRNNNWQIDPEYKEILKDCEVYNIDIRDQAGVYKLVELSDGVIHLAAILGTKHVDNAWNFYETNLKGTINVLEACKEFNRPMVQIAVGNWFEVNNYSNSKVAAEREVLKYARFSGVRANVVRALNAVAPRQKVKNTGKIMATFITQALAGQPISVYGGKDNCSIMDMVYAGDVAKVLVDVFELTDRPIIDGGVNAKIFEAGTGVGFPTWQIAEMVVKACNSKSEILEVPMRSGESERSVVVAKEPYPIEYKKLEDIIQETVEYYKTK